MYFLITYVIRLLRRRKSGAAGSPQATGSGDDARAGGGVAGSETRPARPARVDDGPARPSAASRGPIVLLGHQVAYDLRVSWRNPRARFFMFIFPIVLLVVFAGVFGHSSTVVDGVHEKLSRFYVQGILALSIVVCGYSNLVISITALRESGVLKRRRATPAPAGLLIASQALTTVVMAAVVATILLGIARIFYGVSMSPAALAATAITVAVGTICFVCIGYLVAGMIGSPEAAQPVVQASTLPLWFISGVFIPIHNLGGTLSAVGKLFPVEHLAAGLQQASLHNSFSAALSGKDLLVLVAWGVGAGLLAAWRFSWLPSTATA